MEMTRSIKTRISDGEEQKHDEQEGEDENIASSISTSSSSSSDFITSSTLFHYSNLEYRDVVRMEGSEVEIITSAKWFLLLGFIFEVRSQISNEEKSPPNHHPSTIQKRRLSLEDEFYKI